MGLFLRRLGVTLLAPLVLLLLANQLPLPGVPPEFISLLDRTHAERANVGVFSLGLTPVLTAYWLVEIVAFLVPRWSRLRHAGPEARAPLDRAARVVALLLAALQAWGFAIALRGLG